MSELLSMETGGEVTSIELLDEITKESDIGFTKSNGKREGIKMV